MNLRNIILINVTLVSCMVLFCFTNLTDPYITKVNQKKYINGISNIPQPISIDMYENLEKYSKDYKIPKHIVYNIAYLETRYRGPFDWDYKHNRTSSAGAVGPMQIIPTTANGIYKKKIPTSKLKNDVEFNIITSMILLSKLYSKYRNWGLVCGYYNTGRPIINQYAEYCISNTDYQNNWIPY